MRCNSFIFTNLGGYGISLEMPSSVVEFIELSLEDESFSVMLALEFKLRTEANYNFYSNWKPHL